MEASGAGLAAASGDGQAPGQGEGGQGQEGQADTGQSTQVPAGLTQEQITQWQDGLQSMQAEQERMREFLQNNPALQPPAEETPAPQPADLSFLETETDPEKASQQLDQVLRQTAQQEAQRLLQEQIGPMQSEIQELRSQAGADALTAEFPELKDPAVAKQALEHAEAQAEVLGKPELAGDLNFVRQVFLMGRAMQTRQEQAANGGDQAATLEGAGGASPGGAAQGDGQETAESIGQKWGAEEKLLPF